MIGNLSKLILREMLNEYSLPGLIEDLEVVLRGHMQAPTELRKLAAKLEKEPNDHQRPNAPRTTPRLA